MNYETEHLSTKNWIKNISVPYKCTGGYVNLDLHVKFFMGSNCTRGIAENIREELWSYFALSGLLFLNIGIVLMVYALKRATNHPTVLEVFGIGLIVLGVMATLASWYVHRQQRQKKPLSSWVFCCCQNSPDTFADAAYITRNKYHRRHYHNNRASNSLQQHTSSQQSVKMFSTIEFQTYAEYIKRDNVGVEASDSGKEVRKFRVESQRQKKQVHPQIPRNVNHAAMFVNAIYSQTNRNGPQGSQSPPPPAVPTLLSLSQ